MTALFLIILGLGCGLLCAALILVQRYYLEGPEYLWPEIGGYHD